MRNLFFIAALLCTAINIASAQTAVGKQANAVPTKPICLVQKGYENDQLFYTTRFNAAGHLQESKEYNKNGQLKTHRLIVRADAEGRILEARLVDSIEKKIFVNKFTRDAAGYVLTRERFEVTNGAAVLVERSVYENNPASPCVITKITNYDGSGNLVEVTNIENLDANGSSKSVITDKAGKVIKTEVWKRDDKISGRQFLDAFPYMWIHNRTEYTVTKADGTVDPNSNTSENRVLNAQGYTTSVTTRYADGRVLKFRYEYECQ
jgi:hypothetical protein